MCDRPLIRKEKVVPKEQLGVEALPTITETMEGVLDWLKSERLHKYWPVFSRMNYQTLVGLTDENMDFALNCIGSEPITNGARGRILRGTERLRERSVQLEGLDDKTPLSEVAEVFKTIATTPLSRTENEPNGVSLLPIFRQKLNQVVAIHGLGIVKNHKLKKALKMYAERREVPKADKEYISRLLENLTLASRCSMSPKRSPVKCSLPSTTPSPATSSASDSPHREMGRGKGRQQPTPTSIQQRQHLSVSPLGSSALRPMNWHPGCLSKSPSAPIIRPVPRVDELRDVGEKPTYPGFTNPPPGLRPPGIHQSGIQLPGRRLTGIHQPYFGYFRPAEKALVDDRRDAGTRQPADPPLPNKTSRPHVCRTSVCPDLIDEIPSVDARTNRRISASIDAKVDANRIWGGTSNQVMFDLNETSFSLLSLLRNLN